jgi:hypothetical protein
MGVPRCRTFYNGIAPDCAAGRPAAGIALERRLQLPGFHREEASMARSRIRTGFVPEEPLTADGNEVLKGHGVRALGPGDSSDTGADMMGLARGDDNSDRWGTGERASVDDDPRELYAADIATDRVIEAEAAGLGGGLDQAEEAQLGITDEELAGLDADDDS